MYKRQDESRSTPTTGIVTNKRAIDTSVLVDDGEIIVLGGLLEENVTITSNNVPGLSSIPVLGELFKYESRKRTKTNLMVFLRPYVVRDANRSASVTLDRYDYMRRAQAATQPSNHWLLPDAQAPMLPPAGAGAGSVSNNVYDFRGNPQAQAARPGPAGCHGSRRRCWTPSPRPRRPAAASAPARPAATSGCSAAWPPAHGACSRSGPA